MIYFIVLVYLIFLVYYYDLKKIELLKRSNQILLLLVFVLVAGLRYRMAPDTVAYMNIYNHDTEPLNHLTLKSFTDAKYLPFWVLLNSFCKTLGNFVWLQIATSAILNICIFYFFKKNTRYFFTCVTFYYMIDFCYFNMEILRESMAVSMFLIAIVRYNEKKIVRCYLYICYAALFHQFALILFFVPFFLSKRISQKLKVGVTVGVAAVLFLIGNPLNFIASSIGSLDLSFYDIDTKMSIWGYIYAFFRVFPVLLVMYIYRNKDLPFVYIEKKTLNSIAILYTLIVFIRASTIPFMDRFANYFIVVVILYVTAALYDILSTLVWRPLRFSAVLSTIIIVALFNVLPLIKIDPILNVPVYKRYYPYCNIFTKKTDPDREYMIYLEAKE